MSIDSEPVELRPVTFFNDKNFDEGDFRALPVAADAEEPLPKDSPVQESAELSVSEPLTQEEPPKTPTPIPTETEEEKLPTGTTPTPPSLPLPPAIPASVEKETSN